MSSPMRVSHGALRFSANIRRPFVPRTRIVSSCLNLNIQSPDGLKNAKGKLAKEMQAMEEEKKFIVGTYARSPVVIASGKGCTVKDVEGREYLDLTSGIAVNALGHGDSDWISAVVEQASTLTHCSNVYYSLPQIELAKLLVHYSFANKVFFCNSGTEANEAAIKFSRKFQDGATEFISFSNSFHGRTMGALALTSKEQYRAPFEPLMPGVTFLEYGDIEAARQAIVSGKTAAVFVEPIQGEGGIYSATREFLLSLRSLCDDAGALLVYDEVQCGLGRTGRLWAHEAYDVYPDIMTLAKPLAGGLPIGAVLVTERVASAIGHGDHGSTFAGSPLVCHAALAVLRKVARREFLEDVSRKGALFKGLLEEEVGGNVHVEEIRGVGLIVGIELNVSAGPVVDACRDAGVLVLTAGKGNVVRLVPPLVINDSELRHAVSVIKTSLHVLDPTH